MLNNNAQNKTKVKIPEKRPSVQKLNGVSKYGDASSWNASNCSAENSALASKYTTKPLQLSTANIPAQQPATIEIKIRLSEPRLQRDREFYKKNIDSRRRRRRQRKRKRKNAIETKKFTPSNNALV